MVRRKVPDWLLLIPAAVVTASLLLVVTTFVGPSRDSFFGVGGLYVLVIGLGIGVPLFLVGFFWLLAALAVRRPLRRDVVGWMLFAVLGALSLALVLVGGRIIRLDQQLQGSIRLLWPGLITGSIGLLGLFVVGMSPVPHRRVSRHDPEAVASER